VSQQEPQSVDQLLAQYRKSLEDVRAPNEIAEKVLDVVSARGAPQLVVDTKPIVNIKRRAVWLPLSIAAGLLVAVGLSSLRSPQNTPKVTQVTHDREDTSPDYLLSQIPMPIRVHSLTGGTQIRYLNSHVVYDEQGIPHLVYINQKGH